MAEKDHTVEKCQDLLRQGLREQAQALALHRDTHQRRDPALHLAWADLLEELGLVEEVILELQLARRDDPDNMAIGQRLAEIYLDQGQPWRAAQLWGGLLKRRPQDPHPYLELGRALEEAGEFAKARTVYEAGFSRTQDARFQEHLKHLSFLGEPQEPSPPPPDRHQLLPQTHHLVTFLSLFAGREGVYARQWVSPTGESGYTPVHEPLTPKVAENHILGNHTVGVYPIRLDNTVTFIAFDLDVAKFALTRAITSQRAWEALMTKVHKTACRLLDLAAAQDLPAYIEDSGFKGRHLWIFLESPLPAGVAKKCGELLAAPLAPLPPEVTLEVFPKQATVKPGSLGNLIKLPLGLHRRTGRRALFLTPDGQPYEDQLQLLSQFVRVPKTQVYRVIQRLSALKPAPLPSPSPTPEVTPPPATPIPPSPPETPYDLERDPQFQHLLSRCPVLRAVVEAINRTSQVSREETQVLIHTLGHLEHGPEAVNELFQRCLNADPSLFLKSRLRGNPMSCPKIRARIPQVTAQVDCNCAFDLTSNLYPTPLIHLQSLAGAPAGPPGLTLDSRQFQHLLQDYLKTRQQLRELHALLQRYEDQLARFFDQAGVTELHTSLGRLRCVRQDDGKLSFTLEI